MDPQAWVPGQAGVWDTAPAGKRLVGQTRGQAAAIMAGVVAGCVLEAGAAMARATVVVAGDGDTGTMLRGCRAGRGARGFHMGMSRRPGSMAQPTSRRAGSRNLRC